MTRAWSCTLHRSEKRSLNRNMNWHCIRQKWEWLDGCVVQN